MRNNATLSVIAGGVSLVAIKRLERIGILRSLIAALALLARNDIGIFCDSVMFFGGATLVAHIK